VNDNPETQPERVRAMLARLDELLARSDALTAEQTRLLDEADALIAATHSAADMPAAIVH
jgi:hypothetical protein